jgi:hypothetical protein
MKIKIYLIKAAFILAILVTLAFSFSPPGRSVKIFDVHLHGQKDIPGQLETLEAAGVEYAALSTSWDLQNSYRDKTNIKLLYGLMVPCPNGKVPYSLQPCFSNGNEWPDPAWVEQQVLEKKIDFIGEVLSQYHGISSSDSLLFPYYALAEKYNLPVGIHTGSAGPDHGSPAFREDMGNPVLVKKALARFPKLRVWLMHAGGPFLKETIEIMKQYPGVYTDISAINNPAIIPAPAFKAIIKTLIDAGLEDRLLFGSDNAPIQTVLQAVEDLELTFGQQEKLLYGNAKKFFLP